MRLRPLFETLRIARLAALTSGVTRLADCTAMDVLGIPTFQAVRPNALSLSVSQGKGLTQTAAMVSALLEAVEISAAEHLQPDGPETPLTALGRESARIWSATPPHRLAIRVARGRPRSWVTGRDLRSGAACPVPFDLVSLDLTRPTPQDVKPSTLGLACGNSPAEAKIGALAELLEHDFDAHWRDLPPWDKRATEVDLASIADALVLATLARITAAGRRARLWSIAQSSGVAAFLCVITDEAGCDTALPPAGGTGCHADRTIAALRAILEAAQTRITLIAGARDDLSAADYVDAQRKTLELVLATLSLGPGSLPWSSVPTWPCDNPDAVLDGLLAAAERRTTLPVVIVDHPSPHPDLFIVHAVCPGLLDPDRLSLERHRAPSVPSRSSTARSDRAARRLIFVGPTLSCCTAPPSVEFRPPAQVGDIAALLSAPPEAIGLIDGCFETAPTVWHKELMDLMASGVAVFGASSLGALRASELHMLGMRGVGTIFAGYRDGHLRRDDAVMVMHAPAELGYRPLTISLVDAEAVLIMTPMPAQERRMLQRIVRTIPFRQRTWETCLDMFRARTGRDATVACQALTMAPSLKRLDALGLVRMFEGALAPPGPVPRPPLTNLYRLLLPAR
jgi:ribosomal protein S12 methylthiotransferase accessory factor